MNKTIMYLKMVILCIALTLSFNAFADAKTDLAMAVLKQDLKEVNSLLASGVSADSKVGGSYVIATAVNMGNIEIVKALIDAGANVNRKDSYNMPTLHVAHKAPIMKLLIDNGADIYAEYNDRTAFEYFATKNLTTQAQLNKQIAELRKNPALKNPNMLKRAIEQIKIIRLSKQDIIDVCDLYKSVNYTLIRKRKKNKFVSIMTIAATYNNYEFMHHILDTQTVDLNVKDEYNQTPLSIITENEAERKSTDLEFDALAAKMVKCGADLEIIGRAKDEDGTALMIAAKAGNSNRCKTLIKLGAKLETTNQNKRTALLCATEFNTIQTLVNAGANVLATDKWGQTAIFYIEDLATVKFLVGKGVDVNTEDKNGKTALFSIHSERPVAYLISKGCDVNKLSKDKQSILDADISKIIDAARFDNDVQHLFIPKFRLLIKAGISIEYINNAYKSVKFEKEKFGKVIRVLEPYI
ncbi:MAG: ankyrin repeat domain-containing protein [Muribaculaceae bacterium]|nr:ankyrin repeat domain-containing protein [Muribaculaceae bacterium]